MSEPTENSSLGCAMCNPALQRPREEIISERRAEFAGRMHIAEMGDGYHLLEVPGPNAMPFKAWPGPVATELAASLFRDDIIDAYAEGKPDAPCSSGTLRHYNMTARLLAFIEKHDGDNRTLAHKMASTHPWMAPDEIANELPW